MTLFEFRRDLRHQKTMVPGLLCGVVCVILHVFSRFSRTPTLTNRHMTMAYTALAWHRAVKSLSGGKEEEGELVIAIPRSERSIVTCNTPIVSRIRNYEFTARDLRIVFLRSNRTSNRIGCPIRFLIEFSNRIGRIYHASRNTV